MRFHPLIALLLLAPLSLAHAESPWTVNGSDAKNKLKGTLSCKNTPHPGPFQTCSVNLRQADGSPVETPVVVIRGGMPAHGHGLPTAPEASPGDTPGTYAIKGLKFSMPGEWVLDASFKEKDTVETVRFEFTLNP